jgi:hypothetical protein
VWDVEAGKETLTLSGCLGGFLVKQAYEQNLSKRLNR